MSFLTPLFLLGAAAIVGPILFHLIRRTTRERTRFSSLMFLLPSPPRLSKRHRLENLLLLILRCLALLLLAAGFARPFFTQTQLSDPTATQPKRIVVLVDTSASMRRAGVWDDARARVEQVLRRAAPVDQVAVFTFDRQASPLVTFEDWNRAAPTDRVAFATGRLNTVSPGWAGTHLGSALVTAAEALAETESKGTTGRAPAVHDGPRQIVLVSDVQAGSRLDTLQAYEWPKGVELFLEAVKARAPTNAGVQLVADNSDAARLAEPMVRVRVTNSPEAKREEFKVGWVSATAPAEFVGTPVDAYVPPGQSRVFPLPLAKGTTGVEQVLLRGDDEEFDNRVNAIPPVQRRASVLWLGSDPADDTRQPLFFLRRAFYDTPRLAVQVQSRGASAPLSADDLKAANVVFVSEPLSAPAAAALREQTLAGKVVVVVARTPAIAPTVAALLGRTEPFAMEEARLRTSYAMFAEIDFRHPLFAPFADPRFSDFTKIHVWKYRRFDASTLPDARVLAKFDSGDPAVTEVPVGQGRVFLLAMGWQPDDSQLAVSTKFVPLMWSWLELGGGIADSAVQYVVGDKIPLPAERGAATMGTPGGATKPIPADWTEFPDTQQPGIYQLNLAGGRTQRFAVNLDASESRTAPLGPDELEELGLPLAATQKAGGASAEETKSLLQGIEAENRQKLWRWFIVATLAVLLFESALAGWTARRLVPRTEGATS